MRRPFLLLLLFSTALYANMRAPWVVNRFPSYPLRANGDRSAGQLTVMNENLAFACEAPHEGDASAASLLAKRCTVIAEYEVESGTAQALHFSFILPADRPVNVNINDASSSAQLRPFEADESFRKTYRVSGECRFCGKNEETLFEAAFEGNLREGRNHIRIAYEQPMASFEKSYGYFRTSTWVHEFSYELWPLKEWRLDPGFRLHLTVSAPRPPLFSRLFGKKLSLDCLGQALHFQEYPFQVHSGRYRETGFDEYIKARSSTTGLPAFTHEQRHGREWLTGTLKQDFPDRLHCSIEYE